MDRLINAKFSTMFRFVDMLCINLGNTYRTETISIGDQIISQRTYPEFSLHLQTQWRFIFDNQILLGSRDIYTPFSKDTDENWDYSPLGRPDNESSIFDVVSKQIIEKLKGHHVAKCTTSPMGDIQIIFSNGFIFEAFIPASYKDEEWRLIDFQKDEHLVFYDVE